VQEAAAHEILAQTHDLFVTQANVAVTGDVKEGIIPELVVHDPNPRLDLADIERGPFPDGGEQIGKARRIRVPVSAAVVLETRNSQTRRWPRV
jgi:hypothetical protein